MGLLPAIIWHSWWWLLLSVVLTILYVLLRSAQITGVTQMEQSKPLFERMNYEMDQRQLIMRQTEQRAMALPWDQIARVRREPDAYLLYLKPGAPPAELAPLAAVAGAHVRCASVFTFAPALVQQRQRP